MDIEELNRYYDSLAKKEKKQYSEFHAQQRQGAQCDNREVHARQLESDKHVLRPDVGVS